MEKMTVRELVLACNGEPLLGRLDAHFDGIVIDSRKANSTNVYVSIIGENLDGHNFIESAYNNGCRTFIISNKHTKLPLYKEVINVILVEDTQLALGMIGAYYKKSFKIPYIGVTGSVGKTTTRDMIHSALCGKFNAHKNVGNLNNHLGVPLTLFELNKEHDCAVLEMGMSHFKEIEYLADMVHPQIGVISNVGLSHVENLGSQEGVLQAKLEITKNFDENNTLIINGDDKMLSRLKNEDLKYKLKSFGFNKDNDIYCVNHEIFRNSIKFSCMIENKEEYFEVPTTGEHNILNAMSAILVGLELGLTLDEIRSGLLRYTSTGMRLDIFDSNGYTIINDCYNASPDSMIAGLKVLSSFKNRRKVAILGDMFEMGDMTEIGHREVGKECLENTDIVISVGDSSIYISTQAVESGFDKNNVYHFINKVELLETLNNIIKKDDVILVKASRGMRLEEIVEFLKGNKAKAPYLSVVK